MLAPLTTHPWLCIGTAFFAGMACMLFTLSLCTTARSDDPTPADPETDAALLARTSAAIPPAAPGRSILVVDPESLRRVQ